MPVRRPQARTTPQKNAPGEKLYFEVPMFGGLDTTTDPTGMEDTMSPDCLNVIYDTIQSVGSRKGYTKLLTTALSNPIQGMYSLYQSNGTRQVLYASGNHLYIYNNAGGSTTVSGSPATFTANQQWDFDEYLDKVYGGNGTDNLIVYNGTSYSIANSGITPQYVKVHKNRIYCANKNSSTLYFSDAGNPTSFPVNNFIQINTNDGQNISGIDDILDNLVIFKDESVWILTGEPLGAGNTTTIGNLQLRQANSPVGCSAFRSIQKVEQVMVFMHYSGIYYLQNYTVYPLSPQLNTTFKNGMNQGYINICWGLYSAQDKRYYLGYPQTASTTCDYVIMYDFLVKQFTLWDDIPGSCAVNFKFSGLTQTVLMGDPNVGLIYELNQGYVDIYGDTGTSTGGSSNTLTDTSKSWTSGALINARVQITGGTGAGSIGIVTANTGTQITVASWTGSSPSSNSTYKIGYYDSYWTTKWHDFAMIGYTKKYKYLNLYVDSEAYPIKCGVAIDFAALNYQKALNLTSNSFTWGQAGFTWGQAGATWGSYSSEFAQVNSAGMGRYIRYKFGNDIPNQPWRVMKYSVMYKLRKVRANILTS